jgi:erythrocyte band 7 integral membrane protein
VDAVVYYRVSNATMSKTNVEDAHHSTLLLSQTTLTSVLGTKYLHEILSDRDSISGALKLLIDEATEPWGITVERVEIKDARLPIQLQVGSELLLSFSQTSIKILPASHGC